MSPASEAWILMGRMLHMEKKRLHTAASEFELSPPQLTALRQLDAQAPLPMRELAERLHCDNSNVTGIVDRLESRGLVERRSADHDRRVKHLVLTADGAELREQVDALLDRAPEGFDRLSAEEQLTLREYAQHVSDRADYELVLP